MKKKKHRPGRIQVLIETLWNVNRTMEIGDSVKVRVLIETLWNVNGLRVSQRRNLRRF